MRLLECNCKQVSQLSYIFVVLIIGSFGSNIFVILISHRVNTRLLPLDMSVVSLWLAIFSPRLAIFSLTGCNFPFSASRFVPSKTDEIKKLPIGKTFNQQEKLSYHIGCGTVKILRCGIKFFSLKISSFGLRDL